MKINGNVRTKKTRAGVKEGGGRRYDEKEAIQVNEGKGAGEKMTEAEVAEDKLRSENGEEKGK